jgi:hypothetical protein
MNQRNDAVSEERSRWFWPALAVGWGLIAVGIVGMFSQRDRTKPFELARYVIGFLIVHDLVVAPVVIGGGWLVTRYVPTVVRGPLRAALALSALVIAFSWPLLRRYGEHATNDSALPLDYGHTVPVVLAVVWLVALGVLAVRVLSATRRRRRAGG